MTKTITLDGLTSVKIKQSAYDMARFCWIKNLSEADVFASCVNADCTENADEVRRISSGEFGMLDTESYETLYLNGTGAVEIVTSALLVCPFDRGGKGGGSYELPIATTEILGGVMPDGTTITVDSNGVISSAGGLTVDTLLDITVSKGDTKNGDYSSCSLENNSIITLDGNMLDYKFVYRVADYDGGLILAGSTENRFPCIFDPDDLTHKSYGETGLNLINVSNGVYLYYLSMNQFKIKYGSNSSVFTSRIRLLGIK